MRGNRKPTDKTRIRRNALRKFEMVAARDLAQRKPKKRGVTRRRHKTVGRYIPRGSRNSSPRKPTQHREMARRLAQIERGQLTEANGLVR